MTELTRNKPTKTQIKHDFNEYVMPLMGEKPTEAEIDEAWVAFIESICGEGEISKMQCRRWSRAGFKQKHYHE